MSDHRNWIARFSRSLWPALLGNARVIVARHDAGEECGLCPCYAPGGCTRLRWARQLVADPEILAVEQAARS